jgi:hypothetical protein
MFRQVRVPLLGLVDNMSHYTCRSCGHREAIFGEGGVQRAAEELGLEVLGQVRAAPRRVGSLGCRYHVTPPTLPLKPRPQTKTTSTPLRPPKVPLDIAVRIQSDEGVPIVISSPTSPSAEAYTQIATRVWERLRELEGGGAPGGGRGAAGGGAAAGPKITFA